MLIQHTYTLGEFLSVLDGPCVNPANTTYRDQFRNETGRLGWHGLAGFAKEGEGACVATRRLIREGWTAGVDLMTQVSGQINLPNPQNIRRRPTRGDQGDDVDMQRVWNGQLDTAWRRMTKASGLGPQRVRILVDSIASGSVDSDVMRWRGVAALKLADALTEAGYSVQLESGFEGKDDDIDYRLRVIVKQFTDPLDLSSLAATTALPGFFRALGHEWKPTISPVRTDVSYYVRTVDPANFVDHNDTEAALFVAHQKIKDAAQASDWVTKCIEQLQPKDEDEWLQAA